MARIDDPFDQIDAQHRGAEGGGKLTLGINVAAPLVGLLANPAAGALAALSSIGFEFVKSHSELDPIPWTV